MRPFCLAPCCSPHSRHTTAVLTVPRSCYVYAAHSTLVLATDAWATAMTAQTWTLAPKCSTSKIPRSEPWLKIRSQSSTRAQWKAAKECGMYRIRNKGGKKREPRIHSSQHTLINVSFTSIGRLLTMILLSPDVIALTAGAVRAGLGALVFFLTPPVGALSALLAFTAARRVVPRR